MLRIHKSTSKKIPIAIGASICGAGALLGLSALTYTPELSHAEMVSVSDTRTLADVEYMQEVTRSVCINTPEADTAGNYQYQLKDSRDQKTYWVAKLKDGNCWMTQNLDLDIPASGLSAKDTDVLEDWTPASAYPSTPTQTGEWPDVSGSNAVASYDPGNYAYTTPTEVNSCNPTTSIAECPNWVDVTTGSDMHYSIGNYYSWAAATAGRAADISYSDATQSICPKNWRLPTILTEQEGVNNKSFQYLLSSYNLMWYGDVNNAEYDARLAPLYFLYGGTNGSTWREVGEAGDYWSSHTSDKNYADFFEISSAINFVQSGRNRFSSMRCIARLESAPYNNVEVVVNPTISLDVANEVNIEKSETNPSTANLDVKVSSNQKYTVGISASNPNLTSTTSNVTIPAKSGLLNTPENGWGIKLSSDTSYKAITSTPATFYTASGAEIKTIPFTIGISTAPDIPNGEYFTDITITATQN